MEPVQYQEERLIEKVRETGSHRDLIYFYAVQRRFDEILALKNRLSTRDLRGQLTYDIVTLQESPGNAEPALDAMEGVDDPWLFYSLAKFHLQSGNAKAALRVVTKSLQAHRNDTHALNLLLKYLSIQGENDLLRKLIDNSLVLAPIQADIERLRSQPWSYGLYLDLLPRPETVDFYLPVYNVEKYIRLAIGGLFRQNHPLHEVLVINDGTLDGSIEIAREYPVRIVEHAENRGLAAARNTAFRNSSAVFVGAIDTDAYPEVDYTKNVMMEFENAEPTLAGVGGRLYETHTQNPPDKWRSLIMPQNPGDSRKHMPEFLYGSNTIFRREAVLRVGGYDERCRTNAEDTFLCRALRAIGLSYSYTPYAVAHHQRTDTLASVLNTIWNWQFWGKVEQGVFESHGRMVNMMYATLSKVIADLNQLIECGELDVLYIEFLFGFHDIFRDVHCARQNGMYTDSQAYHIQSRMLGYLGELDAQHGGHLHDRVRGSLLPFLVDKPRNPADLAREFTMELEGFWAEMDRFCGAISSDFYRLLTLQKA